MLFKTCFSTCAVATSRLFKMVRGRSRKDALNGPRRGPSPPANILRLKNTIRQVQNIENAGNQRVFDPHSCIHWVGSPLISCWLTGDRPDYKHRRRVFSVHKIQVVTQIGFGREFISGLYGATKRIP